MTDLLYTDHPVRAGGRYRRAYLDGEILEAERAIGELLRRWRVARGASQEHVAAQLRARGLTTATNTLQRWERTGRIGVAEALVLADVYDITLAALVQAS